MTQAGSADILIIGAGFAGLSAALGIRQQGGPTPPTVAVLESRTRPGGRTLTETPDYLDMGGAYVGSSQNFINHLIQEYGIPTFSQYLPQDKLWAWQDGTGAINYLPGDNPWALPGGMPTAELLGEIDAMSLVVRNFLANPWEMPGAETLDAMTAQDFIDTLDVSQATREGMVCSVRSAFSCEPKDVSWLFVLWYAANAGSYAGLVDVTGGEGAAEATRFTYGTASLIQAMVQDLTQPTSKVAPIPIHYGEQVQTITQTSTGVEVVTANGTWTGKSVVVAMSPAVAGTISYVPSLDTIQGGEARIQLMKQMPMGSTIKGFARYRRPFWRYAGSMGYLLSYTPPGQYQKRPLDWTMDNSWEPQPGEFDPLAADTPEPQYPYSMMTFIVGDSAKYWATRSADERKEAVLDHLVEVYGPQARTELLAVDGVEPYVDKVWSTTPSKGCPTGIMPPGVLTQYGSALSRPLGRIFWAGSESATEWVGYMDGAISSGMRAATQVLGSLTDYDARGGANASGRVVRRKRGLKRRSH